jgi:hypothetical protein
MKTHVSPSMQKVPALDSFAKKATQSVSAPASPIKIKNSPETFKAQPNPQLFRFKKNARGHGGEKE